MAIFEELLLSGEKNRSNRGFSKTRNRIKIGDQVQIYIKHRTKDSKKLFDAIIINKIIWNYKDAPNDVDQAIIIKSPKKDEDWLRFAFKDCFECYYDFLDYFNPQNHPKHKSKYIFFEFEKLKEYYSKNFNSLNNFMGGK